MTGKNEFLEQLKNKAMVIASSLLQRKAMGHPEKGTLQLRHRVSHFL